MHLSQSEQLSEMTLADIPEILLIERQNHLSPWSESDFQSSIDSSHQCYVLRKVDGQDKVIVAYIITSTAADEAELLNITVAKGFQRQGVGERLIEHVSKLFENNIKTLFLEVRASNQKAIGLYYKLAFNEVGIRPNYYPSGQGREDAIIMAKVLDI